MRHVHEVVHTVEGDTLAKPAWRPGCPGRQRAVVMVERRVTRNAVRVGQLPRTDQSTQSGRRRGEGVVAGYRAYPCGITRGDTVMIGDAGGQTGQSDLVRRDQSRE